MADPTGGPIEGHFWPQVQDADACRPIGHDNLQGRIGSDHPMPFFVPDKFHMNLRMVVTSSMALHLVMASGVERISVLHLYDMPCVLHRSAFGGACDGRTWRLQ